MLYSKLTPKAGQKWSRFTKIYLNHAEWLEQLIRLAPPNHNVPAKYSSSTLRFQFTFMWLSPIYIDLVSHTLVRFWWELTRDWLLFSLGVTQGRRKMKILGDGTSNWIYLIIWKCLFPVVYTVENEHFKKLVGGGEQCPHLHPLHNFHCTCNQILSSA